MKVGYPCINRSIGCTASSTFRLASYSEKRLRRTVQNNLDCLAKILRYNVKNGLLFFRISSDIVPFASHPVCTFDWVGHFGKELKRIGRFIRKNNMRISMHPDQFVLINALKEDVVDRSVKELEYHRAVLDEMNLDYTAKIQIHVGGVYGDKGEAIQRFVDRYHTLSPSLKRRLIVENDDRLFSLKDCLSLHRKIGIPLLFDSFHHQCLNNGETVGQGLAMAAETWQQDDGVPMVDYSSQQRGHRVGTHARTIDVSHFTRVFCETHGLDFDIMLEIKDKEKSALKALKVVKQFAAR